MQPCVRTMLAHRPVLTWANRVATESVSSRGEGRSPASANTPSRTLRPCMASVSRHSGSLEASAQVAVERAPPSAAVVSSTYRSSYIGTAWKCSERPLCRYVMPASISKFCNCRRISSDCRSAITSTLTSGCAAQNGPVSSETAPDAVGTEPIRIRPLNPVRRAPTSS